MDLWEEMKAEARHLCFKQGGDPDQLVWVGVPKRNWETYLPEAQQIVFARLGRRVTDTPPNEAET